jgi:hypothetical protein
MSSNAPERRIRTAAIALVLAALCTPAMSDTTGSQEEFRGRILEVAKKKLAERSANPEEFAVEVADHLRPNQATFLEEKGISNPDGIWVVHFSPPPVKPGRIVRTIGGDFTFYFRYPSTDVIAVREGE